jgi:anti-sigma-K factor RskA
MTLSTNSQLQQARQDNSAIAAVLAAPDARIESLPAAGGTVTAVVSLHQAEAVVTTSALPALPGTRVYQLWVMTSAGAAKSAGLLTVTSSGTTSAPLLAGGVLPGDRLGITVEPSGGTAQPTTTPIVVMPVA